MAIKCVFEQGIDMKFYIEQDTQICRGTLQLGCCEIQPSQTLEL